MDPLKVYKFLIIAGEASGDHHGAALIEQLKEHSGIIRTFGIGGDSMQDRGMELLFHIRQMAFLGLSEVIKHLPFIRKVQQKLLVRAEAEQPDCIILIDYPGFNLRMARAFKKLDIPVVYYISPQLWAWGKRRIKKMQKYVDKILVLFPFEERFYKEHEVEATYVGHPLVDKHFKKLPDQFKKTDTKNIKIGLLPGSREQEVKSLLPRMLETARLLKEEGKIASAEVTKVAHLTKDIYSEFMQGADEFIRLIDQPLYELLPTYDAVLVASGTATLETGYYCVPMVIVYQVSNLTYRLGKWLVKLDFIGLVNIVSEKQVARELIQHEFTTEIAAHELELLLIPEKNLQVRNELLVVREKLGEPGASHRAAQAIWDFIKQSDEKTN